MQSSVKQTGYTVILTGTSGTQIGHCIPETRRLRVKFDPVMPGAFHVVRKAKQGKAVFLAGPKGRIAKLQY
jgi:hypothetical protein